MGYQFALSISLAAMISGIYFLRHPADKITAFRSMPARTAMRNLHHVELKQTDALPFAIQVQLKSVFESGKKQLQNCTVGRNQEISRIADRQKATFVVLWKRLRSRPPTDTELYESFQRVAKQYYARESARAQDDPDLYGLASYYRAMVPESLSEVITKPTNQISERFVPGTQFDFTTYKASSPAGPVTFIKPHNFVEGRAENWVTAAAARGEIKILDSGCVAYNCHAYAYTRRMTGKYPLAFLQDSEDENGDKSLTRIIQSETNQLFDLNKEALEELAGNPNRAVANLGLRDGDVVSLYDAKRFYVHSMIVRLDIQGDVSFESKLKDGPVVNSGLPILLKYYHQSRGATIHRLKSETAVYRRDQGLSSG